MPHRLRATLVAVLSCLLLSFNTTAIAQSSISGKLAKLINRSFDLDLPSLRKLGLPKNVPLGDVKFVKVDRDGNWSSTSPDADANWQSMGKASAGDVVVVTEMNLTSHGFKHLSQLKPARIFIQKSKGGSIELDFTGPKTRLLSGKLSFSLSDPNLVQAAIREFDRPFLGTKTRLIAASESPAKNLNGGTMVYASKPIIEKLSTEQIMAAMPSFKFQSLVISGRISDGMLYASKLDKKGITLAELRKSAAANKVSLVLVDSDKPLKTLRPMLKAETGKRKTQADPNYLPSGQTTGEYLTQLAEVKGFDKLELDFSNSQPFQIALRMRARKPELRKNKSIAPKTSTNSGSNIADTLETAHTAYVFTKLVYIYRSTHDKEGRIASDVDLEAASTFGKAVNYLIGFILGFLVRKSVINAWLSMLRGARILKSGASFGWLSAFLGKTFLYLFIFPLFGLILFVITVSVKFIRRLFGKRGTAEPANSNSERRTLNDDGSVTDDDTPEGESGNYYRMLSDEGLNKTLIASAAIKERTDNANSALTNSVLRDLQENARRGQTQDSLDLAYLYATGCGVSQDANRAIQLYKGVIDSSSDAAFNIGCLYRYAAAPLTQSWENAHNYYEQSASMNNGAAINEIGWMHRMGQGLEFSLDKAHAHFQQAVELKYPMAFYNLGNFYLEGMVVSKDTTRALELYTQGAKLGNTPCMSQASLLLSNGQGGVRIDRQQSLHWGRKACEGNDFVAGMETFGSILLLDEDPNLRQEGISLLKKAADAGDAFAHFNLGCYYNSGDVVKQNHQQAWHHFEHGAEWPDTRCITNLGSMCQHGQGVEKDLSNAAMYYQEATDLGNAQAMRNLAMLYEDGRGVDQDKNHAFSLMQKAHNNGNRSASYELARYYYFGRGCEEDEYQAACLYLSAAKRGHSISQRELADFYFHGIGISKNNELAATWYQHAADAGDSKAMYNLAYCYSEGLGTEQDYAKALALYKSAFDNGHTDAACNVGTYYQKGWGTEANNETAIHYYREGAKQGDSSSKYNLGIMYLHGNGVDASPTMASQWFIQAANEGEKNAMLMLADMYKNGNGVEKNSREHKKWKEAFSQADA